MLWGGFNAAMEATNSMSFCVSCHEMRENVFKEYAGSSHYANASGVRATCSDCHVPRDWTHKVVRKVQATNELFAKLAGTLGAASASGNGGSVQMAMIRSARPVASAYGCRSAKSSYSTMPSEKMSLRPSILGFPRACSGDM